ncbi:uncharacterized protein Dere_GG18452, isoform C [Drosophila erecta]|uniref:Uncharacterized protein, isoform C n=1 Tax=Drosophila erecta TaxID=7220 RepID=A0A0Q5TH20_DROER|nr:uncharacterized protein Dere_GG18452, isoform C [Drosophila erecta]
MAYVDQNGRLWEKRPWDLRRVLAIFVGIWFAIKQLFASFLSPFTGNDNNGDNSRRGSGWGSSSWGGGGGGGGGGGYGGGGLRPNRRIGRIPPPSQSCSAGGCCG